jgi:hypothetical protein
VTVKQDRQLAISAPARRQGSPDGDTYTKLLPNFSAGGLLRRLATINPASGREPERRSLIRLVDQEDAPLGVPDQRASAQW